MTDEKDTINYISVDDINLRFDKMVKLIKVLKEKQNNTNLQLQETTTECNK